MNSRRGVYLTIVCLLCFSLAGFGWVSAPKAETYREEFDGNKLDETLWEVMAEGDATYTIENGQLIMNSPGVGDGLLIYWRGGDISDEDFSFEIEATVDAATNNAALIAFIRQDLPPTLNTTINAEWKTMFWCGANTPGWYINNDDWVNTNVNDPAFEGIWKAEIKGDKIFCYFNGDEVVTVDKIPEERFVCFGPDTYTSHYSGAMTVDWIEVSGPTVKAAAVDAAGKLPVMWGELKNKS
ncbi:hypothetical protein ACFL6S_20395 [Candidatus Poribacteria bacterium]